MDVRRAVGAAAGIPPEKLDALVRDPHVVAAQQSEQFTAREKAALEFCDRITREDQDVTDACVECLREHFSEAEIVELTFIVGFQTFASKFAKAFRLSPQGFTAV